MGSGFDAAVGMGPLANTRRVEAMRGFCGDAIERGAQIVSGGNMPADQARGFFWAPTVIADMPDDAQAMQSEPFGPLAPITPFNDIDEAIVRANATDCGLAAYAFTRSLRDDRALEHGLGAGNVSLNTFAISAPEMTFSGQKQSGLGSEMGARTCSITCTSKAVLRALA